MRESGAIVPDSFDSLGTVIRCANPYYIKSYACVYSILILYREVYEQLVAAGLIVPVPEKEPPRLPMDYSWAQVRFIYY